LSDDPLEGSDGIVASLIERIVRATAAVPSGKQIGRAALTVVRGFLIVSGAAALRELLIAREFGVGDTLDAFIIAYVLPSYFLAVIAGSFDAAVIPTFIKLLHREGRDAAQRLLSAAFGLTALLLLVASVALATVFPWIVPHLGSSFSAEKIALTHQLFYLLLPVVLVGGIALIYASALNAVEGFALASMSPAITPIVVATLLIALHGRISIATVAAATLGGALCEAAVLATGLVRRGVWPFHASLHLTDEVRQVIRQYAAVIGSSMLVSFTPVIDQTMAARLGSGAPSALGYATKLVGFGTGVASVAIGAAVMPYFSRMVGAEEWEQLRRSLRGIIGFMLALTVPITIVFLVFSPVIVRLLFQRGAFHSTDTIAVATVQRALCLQIPFFVASIPISRGISALRANHILAIAGVIIVTVKCVLNYVLMQRIGIAGIALSTAMSYATSFAYLLFMLRREIVRRDPGSPAVAA
jgi:putative peptidoglycan lipid II flippase